MSKKRSDERLIFFKYEHESSPNATVLLQSEGIFI